MDGEGLRARVPPRWRVGMAAPNEHEAALRVWRAAIAARRGAPAPPHVAARVRRYLGQADAFLLVAREPAGVVGMALGLQGLADDGAGPPVPGLCHVSSVYVAPERWGLGIGGALVDAVLAEAAARGYSRAQLWTQVDNARARRLYQSRGFAPSGREKDDGDLGDRILHLERTL
jgi:ribosomal protein S18 acetylase RimI-like enzyme